MNATNIFEQATRKKLRFETSIGNLSVEDLWDLPLQSSKGRANLDDLARSYDTELKSSNSASFVTPEAKPNAVLQLRFDLVLAVINVKVAERDAAAASAANAERKRKLMEVLEGKQNEALGALSIEDLRAQIAAL